MGCGMRIATASVRTGFAMTGFLQGVRGAGDRKGRPYGGLQGVRGAGDREGRPYGGLQEVPACGPMWASAPTEVYLGVQ